MDSEGSAPSRSGSQLRRIVIVGGIMVALIAAVGVGSRIIGFSSGLALLAAALATPAFITYVLLTTTPSRHRK